MEEQTNYNYMNVANIPPAPRRRKHLWWLGIVIPGSILSFLSIVLLFIVLLFFAYLNLTRIKYYSSVFEGYEFNKIEGSPEVVSISDYNYEEIKGICKKRGLIFPVEINEGDISLFSFHETLKPKSASYDRDEFYLEGRMSETGYNQEIERLSCISFETSYETKSSFLSKNLFKLPSYLVSYNDWAYFEYAILEKETNTIRYICLAESGSKDNLMFPSEYWPVTPIRRSDAKDTKDPTKSYFSIYR